jgi:hypothetical protein
MRERAKHISGFSVELSKGRKGRDPSARKLHDHG